MNLIPVPEATITDPDVAAALGRAVQIIDPLLDLLWGSDPLGLKDRTHHRGDGSVRSGVVRSGVVHSGVVRSGALDRLQDALAWVLNAADVPGTSSWAEMDLDARINWWVWRVGALDTIVVAFPGFLGAVGDRLPIQDLFGFTSQAIVLCAVAREHGLDDHQQPVRLLAAVLCDRDLSSGVQPGPGDGPSPPPEPEPRRSAWTPIKLAQALRSLMGLLAAVGNELAKRPHPRRFFRYLGMLPAIGAVVDYVGELGALARAAKAGRRWIAAHPHDGTVPLTR